MLIYEERVPASYRTAFIAKIRDISAKLGINPNWLMAIIDWESAHTFSPSVQHPTSKATGLIQFMPDTARELGTTVERLANMSAVEQLDYVYKYYVRYRSLLNSYTDLYLTTFYPAAVGKAASYVLGSSDYWIRKIAEQNGSFDNNGDMKITKGEIEADMLAKIPANWRNEFKKKTIC